MNGRTLPPLLEQACHLPCTPGERLQRFDAIFNPLPARNEASGSLHALVPAGHPDADRPAGALGSLHGGPAQGRSAVRLDDSRAESAVQGFFDRWKKGQRLQGAAKL
ncbi:hypothetical protein SOM08_09015 [Hydrogenophaga sp. SNF1]|uniref:hypothetical protein n=1 Tax=Hydrogenophaga sp. SNF1 TaxID=3098762 RepID=UPI002ACBDAF5|nr:hypothetical protein [Hydrogenophaga sp. SNF1]WQB85450.1 hypothetical protein SOM08_09015 [Hydrogenophaga sp. SNF1]